MGAFSYIHISNEDEYALKYKFVRLLDYKLKRAVIPYMPVCLSCTIKDMGARDLTLWGYDMWLPPIKDDDELLKRKILGAMKKSGSMGADVLVFDPSTIKPSASGIIRAGGRFKISKGIFLPPLIFIKAAKKVSALMGIDFNRAGICIVDASNEMGFIMTRLLLHDAAFLTLCTLNKDAVYDRTLKYMKSSGMSAAVVSDYRKAMDSCDILIYTGGADINALTDFVSHKMLIVNLSGGSVNTNKRFLTIDDIMMMGPQKPVIDSSIEINIPHIFTSKVWEGALLTYLNMDTDTFSVRKANEVYNLASKLNIEIKNIIGGGKFIERDKIYEYR